MSFLASDGHYSSSEDSDDSSSTSEEPSQAAFDYAAAARTSIETFYQKLFQSVEDRKRRWSKFLMLRARQMEEKLAKSKASEEKKESFRRFAISHSTGIILPWRRGI